MIASRDGSVDFVALPGFGFFDFFVGVRSDSERRFFGVVSRLVLVPAVRARRG